MNLTRGDYLAVSGLFLGTIAVVALIVTKSIEASENKLIGKMEVAQEHVRNEANQVKAQFQDLSAEIKEVVLAGMQARTDQVALAVSELSSFADVLTVHVSNMDENSEVFEKFVSIRGELGEDASVFSVNGKAYAKIFVRDTNSVKARLVQTLFDEVEIGEATNVAVRITFDETSLDASSGIHRQILREKIEKYQGLLQGAGD